MSKVIKHQTAEFTRVVLPQVAEQGKGRASVTAQELDNLQEQAYQEGYQQGHKLGMQQGHAAGLARLQQQQEEVRIQGERLRQIMTTLDKPLARLDQEMENQLVTLVIALVRQMFRREVKLDPGQIVGVVRDAVALLPISDREASLVLHPGDAAMVRAALAELENDQQWRLVEDSSISPGGCKVITRNSQIDATVENRLATLIAQVFGGDRERDGQP